MIHSKLIYYLDDDYEDLRFFKQVAESLGHRVLLFLNGHEMIEKLRKAEPDIVFLDVHMPILNGVEILNVIKDSKEWSHIPVVMISGIYPRKLVSNFVKAGANYLMKRPLESEFKTALRAVLEIDLHRGTAMTG